MRRLPFFLLLATLLGAALFWLWRGEPSRPPGAASEAAAPAAPAVEVAAPEVEEAPVRPARPASPLVPLPPDPIAERIARGEELFTLHGRVVDDVSGEPIRIYRTWLVESGEDLDAAARSEVRGRTHANPLGTFTYRGLTRGRFDLLVRTQTHQDLVVRGLEVPRDEEEELVLRLSRGAWIEVTTLDRDGDGESDLEVHLQPLRLAPTATPPRVRLRFTDDYGKALFTNLPPGVYRVSLANDTLAEETAVEVALGPGTSRQVTFRVPDFATVEIHAHDAERRPLGLVSVRMWSKSGRGIFRAETDAQGRSRIRHVPPGEYTVKAYKLDYRRVTRPFQVPETALGGKVALELELVHDPASTWAELHPTKEQLERLKRGERPADVFGSGGGGG